MLKGDALLDRSRVEVFSIVRQPLERAVSLCGVCVGIGDELLTVEMFEDWVLRGMPAPPISGLDIPLTAPMVEFLRPGEADYVGRYEQREEALRRIGGITQMRLSGNLYKGFTRHKPWPQYYQKREVLEAVRRKYVADFKGYDYNDEVETF
jgi:hypothetical protein